MSQTGPTTAVPKPWKARGFQLAGSLVILFVLAGLGSSVFGPRATELGGDASTTIEVATSTGGADLSPLAEPPPAMPSVPRVPLPDEVRGIYWTGHTAGSKRVDALLAYASSSGLNAVVIDLKLDDGSLAFVPLESSLQAQTPKFPAIRDLDSLLLHLEERGIYRIARIAVMRDKVFGGLHPEIVLRDSEGGVWRDNTGMVWVDPASPKVSDYALVLAREAYARGFDEIQFDYVRFASDGRLSAIRYPVYDGRRSKSEVMRDFFATVGGALRADGIPVSFDLFGLACCAADDLNIGQRLADVYPYADFYSLMAYPSHYANGFEGLANPAKHPYQIVKRTLDRAFETLNASAPGTNEADVRLKSRPWIQDFDIGAIYGAPEVKAQIKAARAAGASGWLIWNAKNVYTPVDYLSE
jgi:hypothetical protein